VGHGIGRNVVVVTLMMLWADTRVQEHAKARCNEGKVRAVTTHLWVQILCVFSEFFTRFCEF
jgi:hypothetical protein